MYSPCMPAGGSRGGWALTWWSATVVAVVLGVVTSASAQWDRPPEQGGRTASLGQPLRWHWAAGLGAGAYLEGPANQVMVRASGGVSRDLLSPVVGLANIGFEAYAGGRGTQTDGGARAVLQVPHFSMGAGADYNLRDGRLDFLVSAFSPIRRGGIVVPGGRLRLDWYPLRGHSFTLGMWIPLGDPLAGRGRPVRDYVVVAANLEPSVPYQVHDPELEAILDTLRVSAEWIRRIVAPFLDQDGRDGGVALARTQRYLRELRAHFATRSAEQEVRYFHSQLEHAFERAAGGGGADVLARHARAILLDELILPYNSLLGRKKRGDTVIELGTGARGQFSRWVVQSGIVPAARTDAVLYVFQQLTGIMDEVRHKAAKEWDDPRLAWLPLQYALLPEDHDEQAELDQLLERITGARFTDANGILYVANLQFHAELLRMIRETQQYHVLWIHDFPALNGEGAPDWASLEVVVDGYLATLTERIERYDSTGTLPTYFIFLDQHYYEAKKSRLLMTVLEDPLRATVQLPHDPLGGAERLTQALERLRTAVLHSRVLQAEARQYGAAWLRNRVKIHVNITNRADPSFWGGGLVATVFGYPDNVMRDHRKLAFRDVSEADPLAGRAILTGMGVGEHYIGPSWEDRALLVEGPALLDLRRAARDLLLSQGMAATALPVFLRSGAREPRLGAAAPIPRVVADGFEDRALTLVNGTGYLPKPLNAAKALLYSLLPRGAVIKIPDSLWNSTFYASLLVGACVRGATVSIIAPAASNAPSSGFPQMSRAHEMLTRLLLVRAELAEAIATAGGELRTGLYALPVDNSGFASRAGVWARQVADDPALRAVLPFSADLLATVTDAASPARETNGAGVAFRTAETPKLHLKVQYFATRPLWDAIAGAPEWPEFMATYLHYREATYSTATDGSDTRRYPPALEAIARRIFARAGGGAGYAIVGSQNQDYRGMFMDGEIGLLFGGAQALVPLLDLVFVEGITTWVADQATLDRLIPPVGEMKRRLARVTKDAV